MLRTVWCAHAAHQRSPDLTPAHPDRPAVPGRSPFPGMVHRPTLLVQVDLGGLQALAEAALSGADTAVITPCLSELAAHLTSPPASQPDLDYMAFVHGEQSGPSAEGFKALIVG